MRESPPRVSTLFLDVFVCRQPFTGGPGRISLDYPQALACPNPFTVKCNFRECLQESGDKSQTTHDFVFVIRNKKAEFVPVTTGITGTSDIEVVNGLKEGDEVITGSYKILRTLRSGSSVKIDNSVPKKEEEET